MLYLGDEHDFSNQSMLYLGDEHEFSKTADKMVTFCEETLKEVSLRGAGGGG